MMRKLSIMTNLYTLVRDVHTLGMVYMVFCAPLCYSELPSGVVQVGDWYGWEASGQASGGIVYLVHDIPATGVLYKVYAYLQTTQTVYLQIWERQGDDNNYYLKYQKGLSSPRANYSKVIYLKDLDANNNCPTVTAGVHKLGIWSPDTVPIPYYDTTPQSQIITANFPSDNSPPFVGQKLEFQSTFRHPFLIQGYIFNKGGSLPNSDVKVYGNDVKRRSAFLPSGAQKSWLDGETKLPEGRLRGFYFYVHNNTGLGQRKVLIQIWRPTVTEHYYKLVWQRDILINKEYSMGVMTEVEFNEEDAFITQASDRIGWGFNDPVGLISFDYVEQHKTYFTKSAATPEVAETYEFDNIHLPSVFSVAVKIDPTSTTASCPSNADLYPSSTTKYPTTTTTTTPTSTTTPSTTTSTTSATTTSASDDRTEQSGEVTPDERPDEKGTPELVIYISVAVAGVVIIIVTIIIVCCVLKLRSRPSKDKGPVINAEPSESQGRYVNPAFMHTGLEYEKPSAGTPQAAYTHIMKTGSEAACTAEVEPRGSGQYEEIPDQINDPEAEGDQYEDIQEQFMHDNQQPAPSNTSTFTNGSATNPESNQDFGEYLTTDPSLAPRTGSQKPAGEYVDMSGNHTYLELLPDDTDHQISNS